MTRWRRNLNRNLYRLPPGPVQQSCPIVLSALGVCSGLAVVSTSVVVAMLFVAQQVRVRVMVTGQDYWTGLLDRPGGRFLWLLSRSLQPGTLLPGLERGRVCGSMVAGLGGPMVAGRPGLPSLGS